MRIALLTTDNRENSRCYDKPVPFFGTAPEALLQGFEDFPQVEVHVISCAQQRMQSPEKLGSNIFFHSLLVPKFGWLRTGYQGCIRAVRRKLNEIKPDIVHGQGTERECAISAALSGFPNVITIHGNMAELARHFGARFPSYHWCAARLENFTLPRTGGVFCNSAYTERLVRPRAKKTWRVPNAIRAEFFQDSLLQTPRGVHKLLNVGVISPRKRQLEILALAERMHREGHHFQLEFIGAVDPSDAYGAEFLEKISGATAYARYVGTLSTPELIQAFDSAGALIHFPTEESFGLVIAEALARNLKVFGTNLGGIAEISSGLNGPELFEANNWEQLAQAIAHWLQKPGETAGTDRVIRERYHPEVVARRHLGIYSEVLSQQA